MRPPLTLTDLAMSAIRVWARPRSRTTLRVASRSSALRWSACSARFVLRTGSAYPPSAASLVEDLLDLGGVQVLLGDDRGVGRDRGGDRLGLHLGDGPRAALGADLRA